MNTAIDPRRAPMSPWLVALFAAVVTLLYLGLRGIWDPDEGRYTNVALNMIATGDWLVPHRSPDVAHWTKPPLTYWAIAASVQLFGSSAFAARLPSALAHLACVLLVGLMGRRLAPGAGARAALTYAMLLFPFGASQMITTDYVLTATEALAAWAFIEARFGGARPRAWLVLMWAGFGLAFLTKGPPGVLPLLPMLVFDWLTRERGRPTLFQPLGLLVFVAIAAPWYIAVTQRTPGLLAYFLGSEVVGRVATDEFRRHGEWYGWIKIYAPTLLIGTLPWSGAILRWLRGLPAQWRRWRGDAAARRADAAWLWVALATFIPLVIFCLARSRMPLYVLPLLAPIALAVTLQSIRDARPFPRLHLVLLWGVVMLALKVASAHFPTHKNARNWVREMRDRTSAPITEVLFVDDTVRYGVHLHLGPGVDVEKLSVRDEPGTPFNREYDESMLGELETYEPGQLWICKQADFARIAGVMRTAGFEPVVLGTPYQGRVMFRARSRG